MPIENTHLIDSKSMITLGTGAILLTTLLGLAWSQSAWQATVALEAKALALEVSHLRVEIKEVGVAFQRGIDHDWTRNNMDDWVDQVETLNPSLKFPKARRSRTRPTL